MGKVIPFEKPVPRNPDAAQAIIDHCEMQIDKKENLEACRELIRVAMKLDPKSAAVKSEYGRVLFCLGEYFPATAYFLEVADIEPNRWGHWYNAGLCEYCDRRYHSALEHFERAHKLNPTEPCVLYNTALTYNQLCQPEDELKAWNLFLRVSKDEDENAHARHAMEMIRRGRR